MPMMFGVAHWTMLKISATIAVATSRPSPTMSARAPKAGRVGRRSEGIGGAATSGTDRLLPSPNVRNRARNDAPGSCSLPSGAGGHGESCSAARRAPRRLGPSTPSIIIHRTLPVKVISPLEMISMQSQTESMHRHRLVLASASPRRRHLMGAFDVPFVVDAADLDETPLPGEAPDALARRLARAKALALPRPHPGAAALAAASLLALGERLPG